MRVLYAGPARDLVLSNSGEGRKPGVHLSDILKRMAFEKDKKYNPANPIDAMTLECGFTWERILEQALASRHDERVGFRPEQMQEDGIWMSPDWINPNADIQAEEWKATRKSSKNYEQKIAEWMPQVMSYVRALRRAKLIDRLAVRIRVWFMVGDWSFENKGDNTLLRDYWDVDIEFDKRDLEENWRKVIAAGRRYGLLPEESWATTKTASSTTSRSVTRKSVASPALNSRASDKKDRTWQTRKNDSSQRRKSPAKVLRGTFPRTKTLSKHPSA